MKQDILNFKFENKKDFYVTSKNSLAFDLIQKWPNRNNHFFFLYGPTKCGKTTICKIWQKKILKNHRLVKRASINSKLLNGRKSLSFSPAPINLTGSFASDATAIATPPLEDPSSFVSITTVSSAESAKARACFRPF